MPHLSVFLCLIHYSLALKCYDCTNCPYPWSSFGIQTYGSIVGILSRVQSCYKKEFYNSIDRRLDRVARGALDRECRGGKIETIEERSITYCCYSSYCNGTLSLNRTTSNRIILLLFVMFIIKEIY